MSQTNKVLNNVVKNVIPKIQRDISTIISNNTSTKNIVADISGFKNTLNQHITTNDNLFSLDNVNSLSNVYVKCMNKLNFTLNCIQKYTNEIKLAEQYASVLRPIFENKFTDNNIGIDGYIYIQRIIPSIDVNSRNMRKQIYFFEADATQDNRLTYSLPNLETLSQQSITSLCVNFFNLFRSLNPSQQLFHFVHLYNWAFGSKASFVAIIPDLLENDDGKKWIIIGSGVNITPKFTDYGTVSQLPLAYVEYISKIQLNFIKFSIPFDPYSEGTIYQFGPDFNKLIVVNSKDYPYWNGKLIKNCYINGSNINMPLIVSQINEGIITEYTEVRTGQNVLIDYVVGNEFYTGVIKILSIPIHGKCFQMISINKSELFKPSVSIIGDTELQGNLSVVNFKNEPIVYTDNTRKITCFNDKVGINQSPFEVQGLLDIDNLTQQTILDMISEFEQTSINSYNIAQIILNKFPFSSSAITKTDIATLFNAGNDLYSYTGQCSIISSPIKPIIEPADLTSLYNVLTTTLLSERTFKIIQQNAKEIHQMEDEYSNMTQEERDKFVFSFFELMPNASQRWFLMSIRGFIRNDIVIAVLTQLEVTNIMIDKSYATYLFNITDYISRLYRSINFKHILLKNSSFYIDGSLNVTDYEEYIQYNDYFSNNFDLLPESYMYVFNKTNNIYVYHGLNHSWINNDPYNCWIESKNAGDSVASIKKQIKTLYNDTFNYINPSIYIWDSKKTFAITILTKINGVDCVIGCGFNISSLLNRSMIVKGDNIISGNFEVDDWNNNIIFKVDNVEKTITNSYKVGIGLDNPKSMLDIQDTTVQDVIDETTIRIKQINFMNVIIPKLKALESDNIGSGNAEPIITETIVSGNLYGNTIKHHVTLHQIDLTTILAEDILIIFHPLYQHWNGYTYKQVLAIDPLNFDLIQNAIIHLQNILDNEMIYNDNIFDKIFKHNTYGYKNVLYKYFNHNNYFYMFMCATTIMNYNLNYNINVGITKLMETRQCVSKMACELYRRSKNIIPIKNSIQGLASLQTLMQQNNQIPKKIYKLRFKFNTDLFASDNIQVWNPLEPDIYNMSWATPITINNMDLDTKLKTINLVNNILINYKQTDLKIGSVIANVYDDINYDYITTALCYDLTDTLLELIIVEFCIQDVINPSLNVTGDASIKGDLMVVNNITGQNFVSIDPDQSFVGINTDERNISYRDVDYSTTSSSNIYNAKYQVHVQGRTYPVMVSERIQENAEDTSMISNILSATNENMQQINTRYFGTNSGFTVKRKSNLYDFNELVKCSNILDTQNKSSKPQDKVTNLRYGSDISFEVCDKTNRTVELVDIQGTIDSITSDGILKGGFSVQVNDLSSGGNNSFDTTRRNLMYLDNSGTLFINKINLNGVSLENINGELFWGGKKVHTDP